MSSPNPTPPRITMYGLFRMTRRTYLKIQAVGLLLILAMMTVSVVVMVRHRQVFPEFIAPPAPAAWDWMWVQGGVALFWLALLTLALEGLETYVMLRKFAHAEAEELAKQTNSGATPATSQLPSPTSAGVQAAPPEANRTASHQP